MTIGSILLGLALLVAVGLYVTRPLYAGDRRRRRRMSERKSLTVQKEAILTEIRALDFDYETGKVSEGEYRQQREAYVEEAAELLMRIDALDEQYLESDVAPAPDSQPTAEYDEIEAAIARRRAKRALAPSRETAEPVAEATFAAGKVARGSFCPQCGEAADAGDRFCAYCGHQLAEAQHA